MQLEGLIKIFEEAAPPALAESWDNPGLLIEPELSDITKVLVALDCTVEVAQEAVRLGAQLVLTHHPLFFSPVRRIHHSAPDTAAAYQLIRHGIGLYAAHTNLDSAMNGVNDALADILGLVDIRPLQRPDEPLSPETQGIGRVGRLASPMSLQAFCKRAGELLNAPVRFAGDPALLVTKLAVVGGSGGDFLETARDAGAQALLTGEAKHHEGLAAPVFNMGLIVAGHYETEHPALAPLIRGLQTALSRVQCSIEIIAAGCEHPPFSTP